MSKRFLDSLSIPTQAQLQAAKAAGYSAWFGYLGGPSAAGVWPASAFAAVRAAGLGTGGFWVGLGNPADAAAAAVTRLKPGEVVGHDVETNQDVANFNGTIGKNFSSAFTGAGFKSSLYGLPSLANQFGGNYQSAWFAGGNYYRSGKVPPPNDPRDGGFGLPSAWNQAWQWYGTHDFNGIGVDESVVDDWFVQQTEDDMAWNLDLKRMAIWSVRARLEAWVPSQAAIDSYASQIADDGSNFEQIYTNLLNDWKANGGQLLADRVSALETKVNALSVNTSPVTTSDIVAIKAELAQIKAGLAQASQ